MRDDETATAMCGRAQHSSDRGDQAEAATILGLALAKAEDVHGPDGMIVASVLRSLMIFQEKSDLGEEAAKTRVRLETILKKYGLAHPPIIQVEKLEITQPEKKQPESTVPPFSKLKIVTADA